ncbi:hypothetical protein D3C78_1644420 [compost metagenome]
MAGSNHYATVGIVMTGGKVDFFGTTQANIDDICTCIDNAAGQGRCQPWAFQAHVATDHERLGVELQY